MATKKQRRRREKFQRHEYEYVVETEEGEEVVESPKVPAAAPAKGKARLVDRRGRPIQPPSWQRVLKRTLLFGPILAILVWISGGSTLSTGGKIMNVLILLAIFIPFSYLVDSLVYRTLMRKHRREQEGQGNRR